MLCLVWGEENSVDLFSAIRNNNLDVLKRNLNTTALNSRDRRGATPLMHAAAYGSIEAMKLLLEAGADVNAANDFNATALLWCARDPDKARLLIERGADVNAQSKQGRTPLMLASMRDGGSDIVALLLAKGANPKVKDNRKEMALGLAAETGDVQTMRLLIGKGADIGSLNWEGETPVLQAVKSMRPEAVRLLIEKGADVNVATNWYPSVRHGQVEKLQLTALHYAAIFGPVAVLRDLLKAGANVNFRDSRGFAALTFAVAADHASPESVRALIEAGADVNSSAKTGETPLDWAEKFGEPEIIAALKNAGARHGIAYHPPAPPKGEYAGAATALSRGIDLLQRSSAEFFNQSGCVGCHHQPVIAQAQRYAKDAGFVLNEKLAREQLLQLKSQWAASQEEFLQSLNPGGGPNRLGESLLALHAAGYPPDSITDPAVVDLAESQSADGKFPGGEGSARPPITESLIASTARAIRALQVYSIPARKAEFDARISRARAWIERAVPVSADDFAMRLAGLYWGGSTRSVVEDCARKLLALQHEDGGWSGTPHLASDAFTTGKALTALHEAAGLSVADRAYQRGVQYLLSTQYPDGSWYVRSRAIKFQPYFESGFPFGHDQWISTAATAWAVMAIAPAVGQRSSVVQAQSYDWLP
jgi:ankyrin repeat protein